MFRSSKEVEDIIKTIKNPESELISLETKNLCIEKIEVEISIISKELAKLNVKKTTRQSFKPHEFKSNKKRLSQLLGCVNYMNRLNKFK
jgi:ribosomal protein L29|uniref:Ribosomal protein L29 n=1 Tax=Octactis speculum TaxID=3111310 RepID=A0A514CPN4_9STRA|nr:ribosomal protein L29 [Dictyocha speculum]QDH81752.1 ribosomal protein L29 [Dictyocha speculum]|tara:strand:+ start:28176 stop:28442 length:267 start_codon:yes stop_codon:yes gene_type:complete